MKKELSLFKEDVKQFISGFLRLRQRLDLIDNITAQLRKYDSSGKMAPLQENMIHDEMNNIYAGLAQGEAKYYKLVTEQKGSSEYAIINDFLLARGLSLTDFVQALNDFLNVVRRKEWNDAYFKLLQGIYEELQKKE